MAMGPLLQLAKVLTYTQFLACDRGIDCHELDNFFILNIYKGGFSEASESLTFHFIIFPLNNLICKCLQPEFIMQLQTHKQSL